MSLTISFNGPLISVNGMRSSCDRLFKKVDLFLSTWASVCVKTNKKKERENYYLFNLFFHRTSSRLV